jgi:hypothetical protein
LQGFVNYVNTGPQFKEQYYDYPYILRHNTHNIAEKPLDVVYLSNGEKNAERNLEKTKKYVYD